MGMFDGAGLNNGTPRVKLTYTGENTLASARDTDVDSPDLLLLDLFMQLQPQHVPPAIALRVLTYLKNNGLIE